MSRKEMTLTQAALQLRMTYQQVLRLVMRGALKGGQDDRRHWWVDASAVARLAREREAAA